MRGSGGAVSAVVQPIIIDQLDDQIGIRLKTAFRRFPVAQAYISAPGLLVFEDTTHKQNFA